MNIQELIERLQKCVDNGSVLPTTDVKVKGDKGSTINIDYILAKTPKECLLCEECF